MASETEKKRLGWFKNSRSNQIPLEKYIQDQEVALEVSIEESEIDSEPATTEVNNLLFSKTNQDKISLDVIVAIENMLKDRQLQSYKNKGLEDQLDTANDTINRFKHDQIKKDQLLQEKNKEIRELENNLTNKQMRYDQLLEDYKEFQLTTNMEYEKISSQLETEISKYNKLYEESTNAQYQGMVKINELEEKIRSLEIENQKYIDQYQKIVNEKAELMQTINDFTERMSFSFSSKTNISNSTQSK